MTRSETVGQQVEAVPAEQEPLETAVADGPAEQDLVETLVEEVSIDGMCGVY